MCRMSIQLVLVRSHECDASAEDMSAVADPRFRVGQEARGNTS